MDSLGAPSAPLLFFLVGSAHDICLVWMPDPERTSPARLTRVPIVRWKELLLPRRRRRRPKTSTRI